MLHLCHTLDLNLNKDHHIIVSYRIYSKIIVLFYLLIPTVIYVIYLRISLIIGEIISLITAWWPVFNTFFLRQLWKKHFVSYSWTCIIWLNENLMKIVRLNFIKSKFLIFVLWKQIHDFRGIWQKLKPNIEIFDLSRY